MDSEEEAGVQVYHQLGQDELGEQEEQEQEGERRRILRSPPSHSAMELSIHNRRLFLGSLALVEVLGLLAVATTLHWVLDYKGGMTSDSYPKTETNPLGSGLHFNWHPVLMTISLIFLYGNGALIYRILPPRDESHKLKLKFAHAFTMVVAFAVMVVGLQAAFDSHNLSSPPKPNLYTLHSWVGLLAALLFSCQWVLGFSAFLFPKFSPEIRALILPFHQYLGTTILTLALAAALMGHLEKAIWSNKEYALKNAEASLVNWTGILLVLFVMGVNFLVTKFSKEQKPGVASR